MRVLRHTIASGARTEVVIDSVSCFIALLLAASTLSSKYTSVPKVIPELPFILLGATIFSLVMASMYALMGLYRPAPIPVLKRVGRLSVAMVVGGYLTCLALRAVGDRGYVEQMVPAAIAYLCVALMLTRTSVRIMRKVAPMSRVLIVGSGPEAYAIARDLGGTGKLAREVIGLYPSSETASEDDSKNAGLRLFARSESITDLVARYGIHEVIVAVREQRGGGVPMDQLLACRIKGVPVIDLAGFCEKTRQEVPIDSLKGSWLVYGHGFVQGQVRKFVKRVFDILSSIVLLTLLSPVMLAAMIAVPLDSRGPIFYRQRRVGLGGENFTCLKFRSMCIDSESDGVARWAVRDDPRVTRVGEFIRKTRIDELPQLLSVFKGEMSLVGPRPERPSFVAQLQDEIPFYDIRHSVKPGITGWAQVRYHYGATLDDARRKHQFDLYYVKNNSLFLDLLVLIETVSVVMFREGQ